MLSQEVIEICTAIKKINNNLEEMTKAIRELVKVQELIYRMEATK